MKQVYLKVLSNEKLTDSVCKMVLMGDQSAIERPGQFVNLAIDGLFLRRPISVCDVNGNELTLIYKVVGKGTTKMSKMKGGEILDILSGLGNGYFTDLSGEKPLLIGGGVGVPPMYYLCKKLIEEGKTPTVILGFNKQSEIFYKEEFEKLGVFTIVATADGRVGVKGFVTDAVDMVDEYSHVFTCGPEPMLKAVYNKTTTDGQYSFEERMGCGFGACMGCSCKTKYGNKRICKDGPVLKREEIVW